MKTQDGHEIIFEHKGGLYWLRWKRAIDPSKYQGHYSGQSSEQVLRGKRNQPLLHHFSRRQDDEKRVHGEQLQQREAQMVHHQKAQQRVRFDLRDQQEYKSSTGAVRS
jgi:hypothetical protein